MVTATESAITFKRLLEITSESQIVLRVKEQGWTYDLSGEDAANLERYVAECRTLAGRDPALATTFIRLAETMRLYLHRFIWRCNECAARFRQDEDDLALEAWPECPECGSQDFEEAY